MKRLILIGALALFILPTSAALAVPMCDNPATDQARDANGKRIFGEQSVVEAMEQELHAEGIDAHNSRLWNGCLQTFVTIDGHDVMKFYDPSTMAELPAN